MYIICFFHFHFFNKLYFISTILPTLRVRTHMHVLHIFINLYIHTCMHTYIYTYIQGRDCVTTVAAAEAACVAIFKRSHL